MVQKNKSIKRILLSIVLSTTLLLAFTACEKEEDETKIEAPTATLETTTEDKGTEVETEGETDVEATVAEATEAEEPSVETVDPLDEGNGLVIGHAFWEAEPSDDGSYTFMVSGTVSPDMYDQGYRVEEFYLMQGSEDPDDWVGIATSQEGVDIEGGLLDDGTWEFKWLGTFYIPGEDGKTLDPDQPVNVCFSVHDPDYNEEIYSPTVTLTKGGDYGF